MKAVLAGAMALACARAWGDETADPPPVVAATQPDLNAYVGELATALHEGTASQRYDAAQRLAEVGTPAALAQIDQGLASSDIATQLACARAASEAPNPDPRWAASLEKLLGKDRTVTEAAAQALSRIDTDQTADALIRYAQSADRPFRSAVVIAMGRVVRKRVAQALVAIIDNSSAPRDLITAASAALAQMSGNSPPEDPSAWHQWWDARAALLDGPWRIRVIGEQHANLEADHDRLRRQIAQQNDSIAALVRAQYEPRPTPEKPRVLLGFLNDADPAVRAAAAGIIPDAVSQGHPIPQEIHTRLIELIGDASPDVRVKVAQALAKLAERNALDPLLRQLQIEKDVQVKVALVGAIGAGGNPHAVSVLEQLLHDPSATVAAAAADALRTLAPAIQQANPQQADEIYSQLKKVLVDRTGSPGQPTPGLLATDLRVALLRALAPLGNRHLDEMMAFLPEFLNAGESPRVRAAAMDTAAPLRDRGGSLIMQALSAEPDPNVRAAAARALGMTHSIRFANQLYDMAQNAGDANVRAAAWTGFTSLLPDCDPRQLLNWAEDLRQQHQWDREVMVRREACEKLTPPRNRDDAMSLAMERQTIGDRYLQSFNPSQPEQAIPYYRDALAYSEEHPPRNYGVVGRLMEAYLAARQFPQAIRFASEQLTADPVSAGSIGPPIRNMAETLSRNPADYDADRQLIDAALQMQPPLDKSIQDALRFIRTQIPEPTTKPG